MELLIVVTALCLLAQLGLCFGYDRQYRLRSSQEARHEPSATPAA